MCIRDSQRTDLSAEQRAQALAQARAAARADEGAAKAKFEATADELSRSQSNQGMAVSDGGEKGKVRIKGGKDAKGSEGTDATEGGISRLKKAKERAREEMEGEEENK